MTDLSAEVSTLADKSLLVLDDDAPLRTRLGRALEQRGFEPTLVGSVQEAIQAVKAHAPAYAVLDMRLEDGSGLKLTIARYFTPKGRSIQKVGIVPDLPVAANEDMPFGEEEVDLAARLLTDAQLKTALESLRRHASGPTVDREAR